MKEFWYKNIDEYLEMADNYDNPKTVKMYEMSKVEEQDKALFRAVTYLRTSVIGFQIKAETSGVGEDALHTLVTKCESHDHKQGIILEVGRLE